MKIAKRVFLFVLTNILIVTTISIVTSFFGIGRYLTAAGIDYTALMAFCLVWGFAGSLISLALSRIMAKWTMSVQVIEPGTGSETERWLVQQVHMFARQAGLPKMPQVGIYDSPELNAFATGPTKSRSLVAVSSGLLQRMSRDEVNGVLAHEIGHVANGDMVTMTLLQGLVNAFVMFFARVIGFFVSQMVEENKRHWVQFAVVMVSEILLGMLGMMVVAAFSRAREFRADAAGASLAGSNSMVAALQSLKANIYGPSVEENSALATMKISGKAGGFMSLFSTHPDLDVRIEALRQRTYSKIS